MGELEDRLGDVLGGRIYRQDEQRLAELFQVRSSRVVFMQNHAVIELLVDPCPYDFLDVRKVHQHPA